MKKFATVLKNGFLKSYGALRTFMQNNPLLKKISKKIPGIFGVFFSKSAFSFRHYIYASCEILDKTNVILGFITFFYKAFFFKLRQ